MSRRGAEFQHRTSVFEGAYRAWSHLGRLDPVELETKAVSELDPTNYNSDNLPSTTVDVETGRDYPYEPLPRSGLAHPYVKSILMPWLGSDVDEDGVKLGLETLRTWWQHRRKGQNTSAMKALSTNKMRTAVDEYTRHFFQVAHCLIVSDNEQPPKGLQMRLKDSGRISLIKPRNDTGVSCPSWKALIESSDDVNELQQIDIKGKCIPGKLNLPDLLDGINHKALQMAHRGVTSSETILPTTVTFGDPSKFPVVYQSNNGDINIALVVNGMICAHCVKIVETVLKGCTGDRSPIDGLLDAAADQEFDGVLIQIDNPANARRIAFESARNLSLVGYKAVAVQFDLDDESIDNDTTGSSRSRKRTIKLRQILQVCEQFGTNSSIVFDWTIPCSCTDAGVYRFNCERHSQMLPQVLQNFYIRKQDVIDYLSGTITTTQQVPQQQQQQIQVDGVVDTGFNHQLAANAFDDETIVIEQDMKFSYFNDVATDPIPLDLNTHDFAYIQQALGTTGSSSNQQQQYSIPSPQPVGYSSNIRNVHDQTYSSSMQGSRRNARSVSTQHISALDAQYFLASQYDWVDTTHVENDPEVLLRSA